MCPSNSGLSTCVQVEHYLYEAITQWGGDAELLQVRLLDMSNAQTSISAQISISAQEAWTQAHISPLPLGVSALAKTGWLDVLRRAVLGPMDALHS